MNSIEQFKNFIPSIKGISDSNRKGLNHIAMLLEREQKEREASVRFALEFYADKKRYAGPNQRATPDDPYTQLGASYMLDAHRDCGEIARSALRALDK